MASTAAVRKVGGSDDTSKPNFVVGKGFSGPAEKVICLQSLINKIEDAKDSKSNAVIAEQQEKLLSACTKKIKVGINFVRVRVISGKIIPVSSRANKTIFQFALIDLLDLPTGINQLCADVFKELSEVGMEPAMASA